MMKNLIQNWSLPNRSDERTQLTLRLSFTDYARLQALKEIYPSQSVNDLLCDIIKEGLDEIVEVLPSYVYTAEDVHFEGIDPSEIGSTCGPRVNFNMKLREILESKSVEEQKEKKGLRVVDQEQAA
jgi:hypothetical protein